jgi:hypothetical protein
MCAPRTVLWKSLSALFDEEASIPFCNCKLPAAAFFVALPVHSFLVALQALTILTPKSSRRPPKDPVALDRFQALRQVCVCVCVCTSVYVCCECSATVECSLVSPLIVCVCVCV